MLGRLFGGFNRGFGRATDGYIAHQPPARAQGVHRARAARRRRRGRRRRSAAAADQLRARGGLGLLRSSTCSCPTARRSSAPTPVPPRSTPSSRKQRGVATYNTIAGFSLLHAHRRAVRPLLHRPRAVGRARTGLTSTRDRRASTSSSRAIPEARGVRGHAARDPRHRRRGRLRHDAPGSQRRRRTASSRQNVGRVLAEAQEAARAGGVRPNFRPRCRSSSPTSTGTRCSSRASRSATSTTTLQAFLGGSYVNQFIRFGRQWRVFLQAEGAEPHDAPTTSGSSTCATRSGEMVPLSSFVKRRSRRAAPSTPNRFNLYRSVEIIGARRARLQLGPGARRARGRGAADAAARDGLRVDGAVVPGEGSGRRIGARAPRCRSSFVFLILAALYESWSLPFSVLLSAPVAVFGAFIGLFVAPVRLRRLRADRPHHARRSGREERDPDRRVREGAARAAASRSIEAALDGARLRLRPILMTSFAFIFGMLPLWFATGAGRPRGACSARRSSSGMLAATLLGIFFIPALFVFIERLTHRKGRDKGHPAHEADHQ